MARELTQEMLDEMRRYAEAHKGTNPFCHDVLILLDELQAGDELLQAMSCDSREPLE